MNIARLRIALSFVAVVILLAACSGGNGPSRADGTADLPAIGVRRNIARWSMPLDEYIHMPYRVSDYAEALLIKDCMIDRAYTWPVVAPPDPQAPNGPRINTAERTLFNLELAQQYGYGGPARTAPEATLSTAEVAALESPEGQTARNDCIDTAREQLPLPPDRSLVESLQVAAYEAARLDEAVGEAAERWAACMAPAGISDLPEWPGDMPTDAMRERWGGTGRGEAPAQPASAVEIELAVMDAGCRQSSGFEETLYNTEWDTQVSMTAENEDALERIRLANEEHRRLVEDVIAAHG